MKNNGNINQSANETEEFKILRLENNRLKKDLHRKDKALAEATALLILKKSRLDPGGARGPTSLR